MMAVYPRYVLGHPACLGTFIGKPAKHCRECRLTAILCNQGTTVGLQLPLCLISGLSRWFLLHTFLARISILWASNRGRAFNNPFDGVGSKDIRGQQGPFLAGTTHLFLV